MNSWYQLMMWQMAKGQYLMLGKRPPFWGVDYDHTALWLLAWEMQVRVSE